MKRYSLPRVAHCNEGHGKVPDMTENYPQSFDYSKDLPDEAAHDSRLAASQKL